MTRICSAVFTLPSLSLGWDRSGLVQSPVREVLRLPQHTPIRACQLTFPRYTCPYTNHLPDLRTLPALDARKDVEQHREPVLRLYSQIPKVLLALFLFALVFLSLVLNLCLGLDDVPQRA